MCVCSIYMYVGSIKRGPLILPNVPRYVGCMYCTYRAALVTENEVGLSFLRKDS